MSLGKLLAVLAAALVIAGQVISFAESPADAPDFTLNDMQGKKVTLSEQKGKVVFLDFWATWCPPCRKSIPAVEALAEKVKGKNIVIYGINIEDNAQTVKKFFEGKNIPYTILIGNEDIARKYKVGGVPTFCIINPEGKIVQRYVGYQPGMESTWEKTLQEQLLSVPNTPTKNSSPEKKKSLKK